MPVDSDGNRADFIMDPNATWNRMNCGRIYENYITAASRDVAKWVIKKLNINPIEPHLNRVVKQLEQTNPQLFNEAWDYLMGYYQIVSPMRMYQWFFTNQYRGSKSDHLASIVKDGVVTLYIPPENEPEGLHIIRQIQLKYPPTYGPVSWISEEGIKVTSKNNIRIASLYIILLEKTGDDWSAVSSAKVQHFGVISQVTNEDKYSKPTRVHSVRVIGESEYRIWSAYCGGEVTADVFDRNNNPIAHQAVIENLITSKEPSNIDRIINRKIIPYGMNKPLQLTRHLAQCGGWHTVYRPYQKAKEAITH